MQMLKEAFTEKGKAEKISSMRVAVLVTVFSIVGTFVAHNILSMVTGGGMISMGWNEVVVLTTVLGAKALQKSAEKSKSSTDDSDLSRP